MSDRARADAPRRPPRRGAATDVVRTAHTRNTDG